METFLDSLLISRVSKARKLMIMIKRGGLSFFLLLRVVEPPKSVVLDASSPGLTNNLHTSIYIKSCALYLI